MFVFDYFKELKGNQFKSEDLYFWFQMSLQPLIEVKFSSPFFNLNLYFRQALFQSQPLVLPILYGLQ
jgi:hypothetical protein